MKKAYLYLLIGTILMFFSLGIIALDLIIHMYKPSFPFSFTLSPQYKIIKNIFNISSVYE